MSGSPGAPWLVSSLLVATTANAAPTRALEAPAFVSTRDSSVVGGTPVPPGKWPDAVAVLGAQGSCTGTLIAPDVVLTAGHCAAANPTQVIADTLDYAAAGGRSATVESITAYPSWETTYDVSVIVLDAPIAGVTPRKLGTACTFDGFAAGTQIHLVGFGLTDTAGQGNNTRLNEATAPVIDPACTNGNGCVTGVSPGGEFVAGGSGTDSCFGDSGGPVYLDTPRGPVVIGAVSRGLDDSPTPCGGGGIYVRTDKIVSWLEQTTGKTIEKDLCGAPPGENPPGGGEEPPGDDPSFGDGDIVGGCRAGRDSTLGIVFVVGLALVRRRRRQTQRAVEYARPN